MPAIWPGGVATDADLHVLKNNLYTTLNGAINAAVTSIVLTDASNFPTAGFVTIEGEIIQYTGKSTNTLTGCTRGADGTSAASHVNGATVYHFMIAAHHNTLKDEIIAIEDSLNLTASRALVTSVSGRVAVSAVLASELAYVSGVTSAIQTQLNSKITAGAGAIVNADVNAAAAIAYSKLNLSGSILDADINGSAAIAVSKLAALTASRAVVSDGSGFLTVSAATAAEVGYLSGVTSAIQTQLNALPRVDGWVTADVTWTYASATTFTISGDYTSILSVGDKIKLTQTTVKYFYITAVSHAGGTTTVTITGGTDYTLANAAITSPAYSKATSPNGHPIWFNYTPTYTGFTGAVTTNIARFRLVGRQVEIKIYATGTSNSTAMQITVPITSASSNGGDMVIAVVNNGTWQSGIIQLTNSSATFTLGATVSTIGGAAYQGFTGSGLKGVNGFLCYEI